MTIIYEMRKYVKSIQNEYLESSCGSYGSCGSSWSCWSFGSGGSVGLSESALWVQREFQLEVWTSIIQMSWKIPNKPFVLLPK